MDQKSKLELGTMIERRDSEEAIIAYLFQQDPSTTYHGIRKYFNIGPRHPNDDDLCAEIQADYARSRSNDRNDKESCLRNYYVLRMIELSHRDAPQIRPSLAAYIRGLSQEQVFSMWSFFGWMVSGGMDAQLCDRHDFYKDEEDFDEDDWAQYPYIKSLFKKTKWQFVSEVIGGFRMEAEKWQLSEHERKTVDAFASGDPHYFEKEWEPNA